MTEVSLVGLFRACLESFRIVGTAKHFGEEYELLCSELAVLQLRFLLWGQQLSLEPGCPNVALNSVLDQPEIKPTVIRALESISYLLEETCRLRQDYSSVSWTSTKESNRYLSGLHQDAHSSSQPAKDLRQSTSRLRLRLRASQNQIPLLQNAKWAILDARTFSSKIVHLRGHIDGLERITQAVTSAINLQPIPLSLPNLTVGDEPPPYAPRRGCSLRNIASSTRNESPLPRLPNGVVDEEPPFNETPRRSRSHNNMSAEVTSSPPPAYTARPPTISTLTAPSSDAQHLPSPVLTDEQSRPTTEMYRSFRVKLEDPCSKVLQAALKKYKITAPASQYALYLFYENQERLVTANEKPLILFKELDRDGKNPSFFLRRCSGLSPSFAEPSSSDLTPTTTPLSPALPPTLTSSLTSSLSTSPLQSLIPNPPTSTFPATEDLLTTTADSYTWTTIGGAAAYRYEISVTYKYRVQGTILRTASDFFDLHQAVKRQFAVWDHRLPRLPRHLTRRTNFLTEVDQDAFQDYFLALMGIGDGIHLSEPFRHFFAPRLGDQTHVNFPSDEA